MTFSLSLAEPSFYFARLGSFAGLDDSHFGYLPVGVFHEDYLCVHFPDAKLGFGFRQ